MELDLRGCPEHRIRVTQAAEDAFAAVGWSPEKNAIRALVNTGREMEFTIAPEVDLVVTPDAHDLHEWSDPTRLPATVDGAYFAPPPNGQFFLLTLGSWILVFVPEDGPAHINNPRASLRKTTLIEILSLRDLAGGQFGIDL